MARSSTFVFHVLKPCLCNLLSLIKTPFAILSEDMWYNLFASVNADIMHDMLGGKWPASGPKQSHCLYTLLHKGYIQQNVRRLYPQRGVLLCLFPTHRYRISGLVWSLHRTRGALSLGGGEFSQFSRSLFVQFVKYDVPIHKIKYVREVDKTYI